MKNKIIKEYIAGVTSLREVAIICGTDHHNVKRTLIKANITIVRAKTKAHTKAHCKAISKACKGRKCWVKGKKMPKASLYKNMSAHLKWDVTSEWLAKFDDIEKLKFINRAITNRDGRYPFTTDEYKEYINKFYNDLKFNTLYKKWLGTNNKYLKPSLDHIIPKSKGGTNNLDNLQFLSWFENRCKSDMSQKEWDLLKNNISDYLM